MLEIRKMSHHPTVLFLGARAGELFRSRAFYNAMEGFSKHDFTKLSSEEQFAECYQVLTELQLSENELYSFLNGFLRDVDLTEADVCVAELVKLGLFDVIITTNVDDLLELTFVQAKLKERQDFDVLIPGRWPDLGTGFAEGALLAGSLKRLEIFPRASIPFYTAIPTWIRIPNSNLTWKKFWHEMCWPSAWIRSGTRKCCARFLHGPPPSGLWAQNRPAITT